MGIEWGLDFLRVSTELISRGNEPDERLTSLDFRGMRQNTSEASVTGAPSEVGRKAGLTYAENPKIDR